MTYQTSKDSLLYFNYKNKYHIFYEIFNKQIIILSIFDSVTEQVITDAVLDFCVNFDNLIKEIQQFNDNKRQ